MSTSTIIPATPATRDVSDIIREYKALKRGEWYLLEPGDPFHEEYRAFDDITSGDGPTLTNFVRYFAQDGTELYGLDWNTVKPKRLSKFDLKHFRETTNEMLLGRDGTIIVSCGRWGRREKPSGGGYEYLPIDDYYDHLAEVMESATGTVANRPSWAETVHPIPRWGCVDYMVRRGTVTYRQRLEKDGEMDTAHGNINASFRTADELRQIARDATELADLLT